jgi:hypothetical protein
MSSVTVDGLDEPVLAAKLSVPRLRTRGEPRRAHRRDTDIDGVGKGRTYSSPSSGHSSRCPSCSVAIPVRKPATTVVHPVPTAHETTTFIQCRIGRASFFLRETQTHSSLTRLSRACRTGHVSRGPFVADQPSSRSTFLLPLPSRCQEGGLSSSCVRGDTPGVFGALRLGGRR